MSNKEVDKLLEGYNEDQILLLPNIDKILEEIDCEDRINVINIVKETINICKQNLTEKETLYKIKALIEQKVKNMEENND